MIGHFFMVTDLHGRAARVHDDILMAAVLALKVAHHLFVIRTFQPLIKPLPVLVDGEVAGDERSRKESGDVAGQSEPARDSRVIFKVCRIRQAFSCGHFGDRAARRSIGRSLMVSPSPAMAQDSISDTMRSSGGARKPIVWIAWDGLGVSTDEVRSTTGLARDVRVSNEGAWLDDEEKVTVESSPPDREGSGCSTSAVAGALTVGD